MNINQFLADYAATRELSGTIVVAKGDKIIAEQCFGFADRLTNTPCELNTKYQIGSVTKQFMAAAILKVFNDQVINNGVGDEESSHFLQSIRDLLHSPLVTYLPSDSVVWGKKMPQWATVITPHQLLLHTSGIPIYNAISEFMEKAYTNPPSLQELIASFKDKPLDFQPGSLFSYSNSGYILIGAIIEQLVNEPLERYLNKVIFTPLNMTSTSLPSQGLAYELKLKNPQYRNLACGYEYDVTVEYPRIDEIKKYAPFSLTGAAGGMISSALDLLTWNNTLYTGKVIPLSLLNMMLSTTISTGAEDNFYAYGIECTTSKQLGPYYRHRGGVEGYKSELIFIPKLKMSIISLTNLVEGGEAFSTASKAILANMPKTLSDSEKILHLETTLINRYPMIGKNRDRYKATLFGSALLQQLELLGPS